MNPQTLSRRAHKLFAQRKYDQVRRLLTPHCQRPVSPQVHVMLMNACIALERPREALKQVKIALKLAPGQPALIKAAVGLHNQLGVRAQKDGDDLAAIDHFQAALGLAPGDAASRFNLALRLRARGWSDRALVELNQLSDADDAVFQHRIRCLVDLGAVDEVGQMLTGERADSIQDVSRLVDLADQADRAGLEDSRRRLEQLAAVKGADQAELQRHRLVQRCNELPHRVDEEALVAHSLSEEVFGEGSRLLARWYGDELRLPAAQRLASARNAPLGDLMRAFMGAPAILPSTECIGKLRRTIEQGAQKLAQKVPAPESLEELNWSNFYLPYHGQNDVVLQSAWGDLMHRAALAIDSKWAEPLVRQRKRGKVGLIGRWGNHVVGHYFGSWISALAKAGLEVVVLNTGQDDAMTEQICRRARKRVALHTDYELAAAQVRDERFDLILMPELGHDPRLTALASCRLAPVQAVGWGMPETTGLPTIDGFLSCESMEPDTSDAHYREKVLTLPGIGTRYPLPPESSGRSRVQLGLPDGPLILFPHSPFKIHPDCDEHLARVLREHPAVTLVMFHGLNGNHWQRLKRRMSAAFEASGVSFDRRVCVLRPMSRPDYLEVNKACQLLIDTPHFSGGNTTLDALSSGLPVVSLKGAMMRGRQSAAMLRLSGLQQWVASDWEAVHGLVPDLLREGPDRSDVRRSARVLFEDAEPLRQLEKHVQKMLTWH